MYLFEQLSIYPSWTSVLLLLAGRSSITFCDSVHAAWASVHYTCAFVAASGSGSILGGPAGSVVSIQTDFIEKGSKHLDS